MAGFLDCQHFYAKKNDGNSLSNGILKIQTEFETMKKRCGVVIVLPGRQSQSNQRTVSETVGRGSEEEILQFSRCLTRRSAQG